MSSGLREAAGVSEECMNRVYEEMQKETTEVLAKMYERADPYTPFGALLRHQIHITIENRANGKWESPI